MKPILKSDFNKQSKMKKYYDESMYYMNCKTVKQLGSLSTRFQKYRISKVLEIYTPKKHERVLDFGCGWGTFCFALAPMCKDIVGIDYSTKSISLCNNFLKECDCNNVKFICAGAHDVPLYSESYDTIICADLVEHLYPEVFQKTLDECNRLLKRGGHLVIWTDYQKSIFTILRENNILLKKDISHVDYKSMPMMIESLKRRNFIIEKSYYTESHIPFFCIIEKVLLRVIPIMRRRIAILAKKV